MSDKIDSGLTAERTGASIAHPDSPLGQVGAQAWQVGADAGKLAGDLAREARDRGTTLAGDMKDRIVSAAEDQKGGIASQLGDVADAIRSAGKNLEGNKQEWIAHIVERGAGELGNLAATLRTNDLQSLIGKLEDLARRQPAIFVGAAMAAGFAAVRVGKVAVASATASERPAAPVDNHKTAEVAREPGQA